MDRFSAFARSIAVPGALVVSPTITVYETGTLTLAAIFSNDTAPATPKANPFTGSAIDGSFAFYGDGVYDVSVAAAGIPTYTIPAVALGMGAVTRSVTSFGAKGDGVTDDTAAWQAGLDWIAASAAGRALYAPRGQYLITSTLMVKRIGTRIFGLGSEFTELRWAGPIETACIGTAPGNTTTFSHVQISDLFINFIGGIDGRRGIDFTYFSYSTFKRLLISQSGNNHCGIYGSGTLQGNGPYYNIFEQNDIISDNSSGATTGSYGYHFALQQFVDVGPPAALVKRGPNANVITGGRIAGHQFNIFIEAGNGNTIYSPQSETAEQAHIVIGTATPLASQAGYQALPTTAAAGSGIATLVTSGGLTTPLNYLGTRPIVKMTTGVESGQYREMSVLSDTALAATFNWRQPPNPGDAFQLFALTAVANHICGARCEGNASLNPDGIRLNPGQALTTLDGNYVDSIGIGVIYVQPLWRYDDAQVTDGVIVLTFVAPALAAAQTNLQLSPAGLAGISGVDLPFPYDVVGMSVRADGSVIAGSASFKVSIGGTAPATPVYYAELNATTKPVTDTQMWGLLKLNAGVPLYTNQAPTTLGVQVTTTGAWAPAGSIFVNLFVVPRGL